MRFFTLITLAVSLVGCGGAQQAEAPPKVEPVGFQRVASDEATHGERLARVLGCIGCHGADLAGEDWSDPIYGVLWTSNLTRAAAKYDDAKLRAAIEGGVRPDGSQLWGMPSHLFTQLTPADRTALIAFVRSLPVKGEVHPLPTFTELSRKQIADGAYKSAPADVREQGRRWPPDAGPDHRLGRYIVRGTCAECHGMPLSGGHPGPGTTPRPDLRIVITAYDDAAFTRLLRTGTAIGDRNVGLMSEVAKGRYSRLTDAEIRAVAAYLRALGAP